MPLPEFLVRFAHASVNCPAPSDDDPPGLLDEDPQDQRLGVDAADEYDEYGYDEDEQADKEDAGDSEPAHSDEDDEDDEVDEDDEDDEGDSRSNGSADEMQGIEDANGRRYDFELPLEGEDAEHEEADNENLDEGMRIILDDYGN